MIGSFGHSSGIKEPLRPTVKPCKIPRTQHLSDYSLSKCGRSQLRTLVECCIPLCSAFLGFACLRLCVFACPCVNPHSLRTSPQAPQTSKMLPIRTQETLIKQLQVIFPNYIPQINARKETNLKYSTSTTRHLELDVWFPEANICFEFQDAYHYETKWQYQSSPNKVQQKDNIKREVVQLAGIRLVVVPCWWDGSINSLATSINFQCPDISLNANNPITLNPPLDFFQSFNIPDIGELMYVSFPTDSRIIVSNEWWLGEKYDGIRCCWQSHLEKVYSRFGNELEILDPLTRNISPVSLDGEFWFGRGSFSLTHSFLNKSTADFESWDLLRMTAFDCPSAPIQNCTFETRYSQILSNTALDAPFVVVASRLLLHNPDNLHTFVKIIIDKGGEGTILRQVGSYYEHGRSPSLIKLKATFEDKEAVVIAIRNRSLSLQLPDGKTFEVPPDHVHVSKVSVGDVVTFSYNHHSQRHVPANPTVFKVRTDISWEDVLQLYFREQKYIKDTPYMKGGTSIPMDQMRLFLLNFVKKKRLDPLLPETWYNLNYSEIAKDKRGKVILQKFKGYENAVQALFPEIQFEASSFEKNMWQDVRNRRQFFENYSRRRGFDALLPENWYQEARSNILKAKDAEKVLVYYGGSVKRALVDLFPEIGLERSRFPTSRWSSEKSRRGFFIKYARQHRFDPLTAENWYSQSKKKITATLGAYRVLMYHRNSISRALIDLFPEIGLDKSKFWNANWRDPTTRRRFLEKYAKEHGFNPAVPENWYKQKRKDILAKKGALRLIRLYNGNISKVLLDTFPDIGLDASKMWLQKKRA